MREAEAADDEPPAEGSHSRARGGDGGSGIEAAYVWARLARQSEDAADGGGIGSKGARRGAGDGRGEGSGRVERSNELISGGGCSCSRLVRRFFLLLCEDRSSAGFGTGLAWKKLQMLRIVRGTRMAAWS